MPSVTSYQFVVSQLQTQPRWLCSAGPKLGAVTNFCCQLVQHYPCLQRAQKGQARRQRPLFLVLGCFFLLATALWSMACGLCSGARPPVGFPDTPEVSLEPYPPQQTALCHLALACSTAAPPPSTGGRGHSHKLPNEVSSEFSLSFSNNSLSPSIVLNTNFSYSNCCVDSVSSLNPG